MGMNFTVLETLWLGNEFTVLEILQLGNEFHCLGDLVAWELISLYSIVDLLFVTGFWTKLSQK